MSVSSGKGQCLVLDKPNFPNTTTLNVYYRCLGTKVLFQGPDSNRASYFITNPVPHKHNNSWKPIFYRGDNPKYSPGTIATGRARRGGMWLSFRLWLGDGVHEVLENKRRAKLKKRVAFKEKWRKRLFLKPKPPKWCIEDEQDVRGKVIFVRMKRSGVSRSVEFTLDGEVYRWSGTRMFGGWIKGWSHNMKLIRKSDHALIAAFQKTSRWVTYTGRPEKTGSPPNKKRSFVGQLYINGDATDVNLSNSPRPIPKRESRISKYTAEIDDVTSGEKGLENERDVNPEGTHWGNLFEEMVVFTFWVVAEAEHQLRYKPLSLAEEVAESVGG